MNLTRPTKPFPSSWGAGWIAFGGVLLGFGSATTAVATYDRQEILERVVGQSFLGNAVITSGAPSPCLAATMLAWGARIPLGCEGPARPNSSARLAGPTVRHSLTGLTVREALDVIGSAFEGFEWREIDGVVVVRPRRTSQASQHFLAYSLGPLSFGTERGVAEAFEMVSKIAGWNQPLPPTLVDTSPFSVVFPGGSVLDLLNCIVRSQGRLVWQVEYSTPDHPDQPLDGSFYFQLLTPDGGGLGAVLPTDLGGRLRNRVGSSPH